MELAALIGVTLLASIVQSATGFGFALIAVPIYLLILNSAAAVQVVIIISIAMSLPLWFKLRGEQPRNFMRWVFVGCIIGMPIGVYMFLQLELTAIKAVVAIFVILISLQNAWQLLSPNGKNNLIKIEKLPKPILSFIGLFSGIFGVSMAMPGPTFMLFLSKTNLRKNEIRAAMMAIFVFAYIGATVMQMVFIGVSKETWMTSAYVTPAALIGVYIGHQLSKKINERLFKGLILCILILTGLFMILNL